MVRSKRFCITFRVTFRGGPGRRHRMIFNADTADAAHQALTDWAQRERTEIYERIDTVEVGLTGDPIV